MFNNKQSGNDYEYVVVRTMQPTTKVVNGKVVILTEEEKASQKWKVIIHHLT